MKTPGQLREALIDDLEKFDKEYLIKSIIFSEFISPKSKLIMSLLYEGV